MKPDGAFSTSDTSPTALRSAGGILKTFLVAVPVMILFSGLFKTLWTIWRNNPNYSHGVLIPVIALVLLWGRRQDLRTLAVNRSSLGLLVITGGVLIHLLGVRGEITLIQGYAFIAVLIGLVLHFAGWHWLWAMAFPIAFLVFMLPGPPFLMNQISFELKSFASKISGIVLNQIGIPVWRQGAILYLPAGPLAIENPCSGLRSLLALLALGALMARAGSVPYWKRVVLFSAAWPVAILANIIRVISLGLVATFHTLDFAVGTAHDISGYVLFALALGILELIRRILRW